MHTTDHSRLRKEAEYQLAFCRYKARRQREMLVEIGAAEVPGSKAMLDMFENLAAIHLADREQLSRHVDMALRSQLRLTAYVVH